jgi:HK97 gp10 family phage protein
MRVNTKDFEKKSVLFQNYTLPKMKQFLLNKLADEAVERAKDRCPVDTGNLKTTIRKEYPTGDESKSIYVSAGGMMGTASPPQEVDYAIYVHEGTRSMVARPFLEQGAREAVRVLKWGQTGKLFTSNIYARGKNTSSIF